VNQGIVGFAINPQLRPRIPPAVLDELARVEARIRSGELVVPRGAF
jgi:hypothetical protein